MVDEGDYATHHGCCVDGTDCAHVGSRGENDSVLQVRGDVGERLLLVERSDEEGMKRLEAGMAGSNCAGEERGCLKQQQRPVQPFVLFRGGTSVSHLAAIG